MKEIQLTQGKVALVDDADYKWLNQWGWFAHWDNWNWYALRGGPYRNGKQTIIRMHRQIMGPRPGQRIDHCNGKGLDNQRENLRFCTNAQNVANARKRTGCISQYKGVTLHRQSGKWRARIGIGYGKKRSLGLFSGEIAAAVAYNKAATEHFGEFARLNVVDAQ